MHARNALFIATALIAGCADTPPAAHPPDAPVAFRGAGLALAEPAEAQPRGAWWQVFQDATLNDLVERAQAKNTDIAAAAARLQQSRALLQQAEAGSWPQLGASAGLNRQGGPLINAVGASGTLVTATLGASYEPDLFGRLARAQSAAALDVRAREALLQSTRLAMQADLAQTYLALRAAEAEAALAARNEAAWQDTLALTDGRRHSGALAADASAPVQAALAEAQARTQSLRLRREQLAHALAVLVGEPASSFELPAADWRAAAPQIPAGIPAAVLARRPDVAAAQAALLAAQARLGLAQRAWFPSFALTASGGQASPDLGTLLQSSMRFWGVGALLALPLLDGGRREAGVRQAEADADLALADSRARVLAAFREVEDQLAALQSLAVEQQGHETALRAATQAQALMQSRWRAGLVSRFEVLAAERTELLGRQRVLQTQAARVQATVGLVRALGGGWG